MLKALYVILISLGLALVFNLLFFGKLIGISVLIFTVILLGAVLLFRRSQQLPFQKTWWLVLLITFFAAMPSIRANEFLNFLNICAVLGLLMLLAHELKGTPTFIMRLRNYAVLMILAPLRMLASALSTVSLLGQVHSKVKQHDMWLRIFKGALMAVPVLIIFGVLFSQADLAFSQFVKSFVDINISERTIQYLVLLAIVFVSVLSFLSYIFISKQGKEAEPTRQSPVALPGREIEVMVFLGLISTLFLVFIGFQINYLFGGETNIINAGFTYAEYARRGFWELLAVGILSLLVLVASEKYADAESKKDKRFLIPALILIAEVVIVIISAFKRLSLYIDAYSMTSLRFYVSAFIMLLLVWFVLFAIKLIIAKREQFFTFGALLSVAGFLMTINFINPDAFIAKANLEQYNRTGKLDVHYLRELSVDAVHWKVELYNKLEGEDKAALRELLQNHKDKLQRNTSDWQSANISRTRALQLLENNNLEN